LQLATQLLYRSRKLDVEFENKAMTAALGELIGEVTQEKIAELLTSAVQLARKADLDAESCLRAAMGDYRSIVLTHEQENQL
jgi:predicted aconitase